MTDEGAKTLWDEDYFLGLMCLPLSLCHSCVCQDYRWYQRSGEMHFGSLAVPPCNLCVLCPLGIQRRKGTAARYHIRLHCCYDTMSNTTYITVFITIDVAKCGLELGHLYVNLLVLIAALSLVPPTVYLPCWVVLLSSDSPSICLSRLMNGKKNICFLWRWWPTAHREREGKWMLKWSNAMHNNDREEVEQNVLLNLVLKYHFVSDGKKLINNTHAYTIVDLRMTRQCWERLNGVNWQRREMAAW